MGLTSVSAAGETPALGELAWDGAGAEGGPRSAPRQSSRLRTRKRATIKVVPLSVSTVTIGSPASAREGGNVLTAFPATTSAHLPSNQCRKQGQYSQQLLPVQESFVQAVIRVAVVEMDAQVIQE